MFSCQYVHKMHLYDSILFWKITNEKFKKSWLFHCVNDKIWIKKKASLKIPEKWDTSK